MAQRENWRGTIPDKLKARADKYAKSNNISRSDLTEQALEQVIEKGILEKSRAHPTEEKEAILSLLHKQKIRRRLEHKEELELYDRLIAQIGNMSQA